MIIKSFCPEGAQTFALDHIGLKKAFFRHYGSNGNAERTARFCVVLENLPGSTAGSSRRCRGVRENPGAVGRLRTCVLFRWRFIRLRTDRTEVAACV